MVQRQGWHTAEVMPARRNRKTWSSGDLRIN
jgi:hypothetical protein